MGGGGVVQDSPAVKTLPPRTLTGAAIVALVYAHHARRGYSK